MYSDLWKLNSHLAESIRSHRRYETPSWNVVDILNQLIELSCTQRELGQDLRYRGLDHVFAAERMGDLTHQAFHLNDIR